MKGWSLRWKLMQTQAVRNRLEQKRKPLESDSDKSDDYAGMKEEFRKTVKTPSLKERRDAFWTMKHRPDIWRGQVYLERYDRKRESSVLEWSRNRIFISPKKMRPMLEARWRRLARYIKVDSADIPPMIDIYIQSVAKNPKAYL